MIRLLLADPSLAWRIYALASFAIVFIVVLLNVVFVIPELARESWDWIHDALQKPDVDRATCDRARLNLVVSVTDRRKGASS